VVPVGKFAFRRYEVAVYGIIIEVMRVIEARYEEGLLKPETPLALTPGERVALIVVRHPDPRRWDLERLAKSGAGEDRVLAEQGLAEWADALDREDHS
jgi:predicted DNA-binding antitoxin AbrB/MazE fold protein